MAATPMQYEISYAKKDRFHPEALLPTHVVRVRTECSEQNQG
jgi:hypothetical protein